MKVVFLGMLVKKSGGCVCRRRSNSQLVNTRTFFLPSGKMKTFRVGREEYVSDSDGEFLLKETYTSPTGETIHAFKVV